ncbi:hypothetical protein KM031_22265 (plasmid) [Gemmobacter fulvus]|uniref:Sulfotransferase family protein n=1 Tax=Gemmobacter fulvus TaxID=2840474 RepID=A0A975S3F7_9RHOB|nr:hypothetical protein [Gemmobacter fulvus]MBT9248116.1 hypothetical protein [Gemmobacter fulvus]QWK93169.1 hypothetical protein KM031_22265 [Gemmobacter fulvus]
MRYVAPFSSLNENLIFDDEDGQSWVKMSYEAYKSLLSKLLYAVDVDEDWYCSRYPDVDQAIREGAVRSAHDHFVTSGYFEGRLPSGTADTYPSKQPVSSHNVTNSTVAQKSQQENVNQDLILHIGHGKTGTSFIQSVLALNKDRLERFGVLYPGHESDVMASDGRITSGNGDLILNPEYKLNSEKSYLFSNEDLFNQLLEGDTLERVVLRRGFNLRVVLYTRNVFEVLFSGWGQWIKRGGLVKDLNSFLIEDSSNYPFSKVALWLDAAERYGFDLTVRNYSNYKTEISDIFIKDLFNGSAPGFDVTYPKTATVNRSLTLAEYEFQRVFNKNLKGSSDFVSDVLVDACPEVKASKLKCTEVTYDVVVSRIKPIIDDINRRIPESEKVIIEGKDAVVSDEIDAEYTISAKQIEVMVDSICNRIKMSLHDDDANYLCRIAEKIVNKKEVKMDDALCLMMLAKRARPNGKYIGDRVAEWTYRLTNKNSA